MKTFTATTQIIHRDMNEKIQKAKQASRLLATVSDEKRNRVLRAVADAIIELRQYLDKGSNKSCIWWR